jgi:hypothetical protein
MLQKRERPKFLCVPQEQADFFTKRVVRSYFKWAYAFPHYSSFGVPTDHLILGDASFILGKIARLEIHEDTLQYSLNDQSLIDFEDRNDDSFMTDILTVLNFHHLSYYSETFEKYKNLPVEKVW